MSSNEGNKPGNKYEFPRIDKSTSADTEPADNEKAERTGPYIDSGQIGQGIADNEAKPNEQSEGQKTPESEKLTISLDSASADESSEGGEWTLLSKKIKTFIRNNRLLFSWKKISQWIIPSLGIAALILLSLISNNILDLVSHVPLAPRLFQLAGFCWITWFSVTKIARSKNRKEFLKTLENRLQTFLGNAPKDN